MARSTRTAATAITKQAAAWPFAVVLVLAGLWAYSNSFHGVFVGDDMDAIVDNPHITSLSPLGRALSAPRDTTAAGRPVVSGSLALNYALAAPDGLAPRGYHAFNLVVHLAAGLVLFGVVRRTLLADVSRARLRSVVTSAAFATALLWVVHPLQTSAVTYVIQRAEALMGLFMLLTVYCAIRATDERPERWPWWAAGAVATSAMGMASKETMVVAPFVVAAWIWTFRPAGAFRDPRPRVVLAGVAATWLLLAWLVASDARGESVGFGLGGWAWWSYLRTQSAVIVHYLQLAVVPAPLVFSYDWPPAASWLEITPQFVLLALLCTITALELIKRRPAGFAGAWFFLILAPSSSLLPIATEVAAEHRMYLPLAAVVCLVVVVVFIRLPRAGAWVLVAAIATTFGVMTHARNHDYRSVEALMQDTVEKRPRNAKARVALGGHLLGLGRFAEAEGHLRAAIDVPQHPGSDPGLPALGRMYLGSALAAQNKLDEGIQMLEQARSMRPDLGEPHAFLGEAYASQGRLVEAVESFDRAAAALPDVPPVLERAARLRATASDPRARDGARAVRYAERAVEIEGGRDWRTLDTLGAAYAEAGRFAEAISSVRRAMAVARADGEPAVADLLKRRLLLYESGQPLREP